MMNEQVYENMKKYAAMLAGDGYIECGYIAVKADDGIYITTPDADFKELAEDKIAYVTDKSVEELEGNFRAAAVLLICALKAKQDDGAAAIVDSKSILEFSAKKMTLPPILEDSAQINGVSVRATKQNTAAEVVGAISGARNACFLPEAGAVVTGRTLAEVYTCTLVLDKACNGYLLAEKKGGAKHLNAFEAWLEHMVYKLKYSKKNQTSQKAAEEGKEVDTAEKPSAIDTDELRAVAQEIKDAGVLAGVSINPGTPVVMAEPVLHMADLVLVMSVNPGYGGQSFIAEMLDKVRELRMRRAELGLGYLIEIDGGVNLLNAAAVCEAGCDAAVAGNAVFGQPNPAEVIRKMRASLE